MGVVAVELLCSRSVRSSFDVVLEPESKPTVSGGAGDGGRCTV